MRRMGGALGAVALVALVAGCERGGAEWPSEAARTNATVARVSRQVRPLVWEDFDYTTGVTLAGLNGGGGWTGPWQTGYGGTSLATAAPGLSVASVPSTGGKAVFGSQANGISSSIRTLPLMETGVVYIEFLAVFPAQLAGMGTPNLRLMRGTQLTGGVGANGSSTYALLDAQLSEIASAITTAPLDQLTRVIVGVDYGCKVTRLWTNPASTFDLTNPPAPTVYATDFAPSFDTMEFMGRAIEVDGVRITRVTGPGVCRPPSQ